MKTLDQMLDELAPARRAEVERRARELIAEAQSRRELAEQLGRDTERAVNAVMVCMEDQTLPLHMRTVK